MITIGYSTRESNPNFQEYLKKSSGIYKVQVIEKVNNGEKSLSQIYNEIISESQYDIVILCHDDIYFESNNWGKKIIKNFENSDYGIIGVAGTTNISESGRWWEDMTKMSGIVNHENGGKKWESKYSNSIPNTLQEVCLIDGVFISFNKNKIEKKFNESVKGFHFYDVYFSVENFQSGVKIAVTHDIRVTHKSIGMTNEKWEENRIKFSEEFKDFLPIKITPKIDYSKLSNNKFNKKHNLIVQTKSNVDITNNFIENLSKLNLISNLNIFLISNEHNYEELKKINYENVRIFEGYFNNLNKNLSILKWDENFTNDIKNGLIFFSTDDIVILNDVFTSMEKIYQKEKNILSVIFPSVLNKDYTIFSNGINIISNNDNKINIELKNQLSYYNILQGYKNVTFGNISPLFSTTYSILDKNDWFEIDFESDLFSLVFSVKTNLKNLKSFVDTNSIVKKESEYFSDENINNEFQKIMGFITQNNKLISKFKKIK
jgi:hypothetical protein